MRALTSQHPVTHQKELMLLDKKVVRKGDQSHLMQPNSFIDLLDTDYEMDEAFYNFNIPIIYILIQGLYHGAKLANIWVFHMYHSKHTRQKSLQKYMKFWKSRLARLNNMFDSYIKEN